MQGCVYEGIDGLMRRIIPRLAGFGVFLGTLSVSALALASEGGGGMVDVRPNVSLFIQIVNFLVLMVALNYLLYRPIRGILKKRADKFASLNSDITTSRENEKAKQGELEAQLAEARRQGVDNKDEYKAEGRAKERELIEAATAEMEKAVAEVREQIAQQMGQARQELKDQVRDFGRDLAQKILGRSIQ